MQTIKVDLGQRGYPLWIGKEEVFKKLSPLGRQTVPILITTPPIRRACLNKVKEFFPFRLIEIPDGERFKNLQTAALLYRQLIRLGADRKTVLLLLGGGVVGDLGGFVAATYLRGVPYFQIPTTLVGQIDSSIGGKVAVDLPEGKNLIGSFYHPRGVVTYLPFLKTLPHRELRAGLAEAIKYGLIADPSLYELTQRKPLSSSLDRLSKIVVRSARIKSQIVAQDEKEERGIRRILNFGHTFGHALEKLTHFLGYRHGEAVAIGMSLAAILSARLGYCSERLAARVVADIKSFGLPIAPPPFTKSQWLHAIGVDKKKEQGMIHFVFLKEIGTVTVERIEPTRLVGEILKEL